MRGARFDLNLEDGQFDLKSVRLVYDSIQNESKQKTILSILESLEFNL